MNQCLEKAKLIFGCENPQITLSVLILTLAPRAGPSLYYYAGPRLRSPVTMAPRFAMLFLVLTSGRRPQFLLGEESQHARSSRNWTFVGCSMVPGFEFGRIKTANLG